RTIEATAEADGREGSPQSIVDAGDPHSRWRARPRDRGSQLAVTDSLHCILCGEPAVTFDPQRGAWVCQAHALHVGKRERAAVEAMERDDRSARTHYLIGRRAE